MRIAVISSLIAALVAFWLGQKVQKSFCQEEIIKIEKEKNKSQNEELKNKETTRKRIQTIKDLSTRSIYDKLPEFCKDC